MDAYKTQNVFCMGFFFTKQSVQADKCVTLNIMEKPATLPSDVLVGILPDVFLSFWPCLSLSYSLFFCPS